MLHARPLRDDHSRVAGAILAFAPQIGNRRLPNEFTGLLVERDDAGVGGAGHTDEAVPVHERGLAVAPTGHAFAAEVSAEVLFPNQFACVRFQAGHVAIVPDREQEPAVHRGRAVRLRFAACGDGGGPNFLAVIEIERGHEHTALAVLFGGALGEDAPVGDGDAGHAAAQALGAPSQWRAIAGPFFEQTRLGRDAVAVRAAPLRPLLAGGKGGAGQSKKARSESVLVSHRLEILNAAADVEISPW